MNVNRQRPLPPAADRDPFCGSVAVLRHRGLFQEIPFEISTMTRALLFLMIATLACAKRLDAQLAPEIGYVFPSGAHRDNGRSDNWRLRLDAGHAGLRE